jgi:hypothetical protein
MTTEIVIARYNENLDWLKNLDPKIKITIYNKGPENINYPYIKLQNNGRETHTYLYHIVNNYNKLSDLTIFCQGDSIWHSPDFIKLINNYRNEFEPVQPLSAFYWPAKEPPYGSIPLEENLKNTELYIKDCKINVFYIDDNLFLQYPYYQYENHINAYGDYIKKIYNITNPMEFTIKRFLLDVDLTKPKELYPFCFAGLFAVKKHVILDHSIDYYNNMLNILLYDIHPDYHNISKNKNFDLGILFERLWLIIFNYKKYNNNYKKLLASKYILEDKSPNIINNKIKFKIYNKICNIYIKVNTKNQDINITLTNNNITSKIINLHNNKTFKNKTNISLIEKKKKFKILSYNNKLIIICNSKNIYELDNIDNKIIKIILCNISKKWHYKDYYNN